MLLGDVLFESIRFLIVLVLVGYLWNACRNWGFVEPRGWQFIKLGFALVLFGSLLDLTDNFEALNRFVVIGNTSTEAFLEKIIGYLGGFLLISFGVIRWGPTMGQMSAEISKRKLAEDALLGDLGDMKKHTADLKAELNEQAKSDAIIMNSESTSRALLEGSPVCNKIIDLDSRLLYMSSAGIKMLKIPDIRDHYGAIYPPEFYDVSVRAPLVQHLERAKAGETTDVECPLYSTEGDEVWLHTTFVPARNTQGKVEYVIASSVDISKRKMAELESNRAKSEAVRANKAKSEFLANMSHDLRTPLNAILGFTQMMESKTFGPLGDHRYEEYANDILNSGHFLTNLINDILDVSKIEAGKYVIDEEQLDVAALIDASIKMLSTMTNAKGLQVETTVAANLPSLLSDERAMTQILNNLLSNAAKFTPRGGTITVSATKDDGDITISVSDSGIGICEADTERVFAPFEQSNSMSLEAKDGTGLGLHLCQKLMRLHNGEITLQSELGKGTCVKLRFPKDRTGTEQSGEAHAP